MIGAIAEAIERGEDRSSLRRVRWTELGIETARSRSRLPMDDAEEIVAELGLPVVIRPSFTLGGAGGGIAYNRTSFDSSSRRASTPSPAAEVLVEESHRSDGKSIEMEVMRDRAGNAIIICSIENVDPMGVHTGDSITVAPASDAFRRGIPEHARRAHRHPREIGVETGGSNVQFAVNPKNGRMVVIEMNPRVSRSSALASKATGFPIAKARRGWPSATRSTRSTNDITEGDARVASSRLSTTVVVKVPRFAFEKFQGADDTLSTR